MNLRGVLTDFDGNQIADGLDIHLDESDPNNVGGYFDVAGTDFLALDVNQPYYLDLDDGRPGEVRLSVRPFGDGSGHRVLFSGTFHS